jgi:hypothetical protein
MKNMVLFAGLILFGFAGNATAQDATCAKLKNKKHQAACNCNVSGGGYATEEGNGRIRWFGPRGGSQAVSQCLARIG